MGAILGCGKIRPVVVEKTCMSPCVFHHAAGSFEYALYSVLPHPSPFPAAQWTDMRMEELCQCNNSSHDFMTLQTVISEQIFHQGHLKRHMKIHSNDDSFFLARSLSANTASRVTTTSLLTTKRHKLGKVIRYCHVPSLDESSSVFNPQFRGQLAPDGSLLYTGQARISG